LAASERRTVVHESPHYLAGLIRLPVILSGSAQVENRLKFFRATLANYGAAANRIIEAALHYDAGHERLALLCDRIGNRLSGSASLLKAVKWSAEEMRKAGLTNVVTPPVMVLS
jgi:hypothetical protein